MDKLRAILDKADELLTKSPVRAIGYGAAVTVVGVVALANAFGVSRFGANLSIEDALVFVTTAITTLVTIVEGARRYVFSPASVAAIVAAVPSSAVSQEAPAEVDITDPDA